MFQNNTTESALIFLNLVVLFKKIKNILKGGIHMRKNIFAFIAALTVISSFGIQAFADEIQPSPPSGATPPGGFSGGQGGAPGGNSNTVTSWDSVKTVTSDTSESNQKYSSTGTDENAVHVSDGTLKLDNPEISRNSSDSSGGDSASFYGVGAALLSTGGSALINGGNIDTDSKGGAGLFAYSDGIIYAQNTKINTKQDTSGGVHAAGGGKLYGWDLDVTTNGESSAAIRSDRGGGTMVLDGGTYKTTGTGSPSIYCTADIAVNNANLEAENSEGVCIEGKNNLHIFNSNLKSVMPKTEQNENLLWSVIVYQSMSGDSEDGSSTFYMDGGSLSSNGDIIYTTNTKSNITLKDVDITTTEENPAVLRATGNANGRGWGSSGQNGADCTFTAISQDLNGNVIYDSISSLDFYLTDGSNLTGAVIDDETDAVSGGNGDTNIYIDKNSTWTVTQSSTCTNLYVLGNLNDKDGNTVTVKDSSGNILEKGSGDITVTVSGNYEKSADLTNASKSDDFSNYSIEKPDFTASFEDNTDENVTETSQSCETSEEITEMQTENTSQITDAETEISTTENTQKNQKNKGLIAVGIIAGTAVIVGIITAVILKLKNK